MSWGNWGPIQRKQRDEKIKEEIVKVEAVEDWKDVEDMKVVRFVISPKKKKIIIEVNKIMNPAFLLASYNSRFYYMHDPPVTFVI